MAEPIKRVHYFDHQFLREADFTDEQDYHLGMRRRHNRFLHTWGIADGLMAEFETGASAITVRQGEAIDSQGREIVLTEDRSVELSGFPADAAVNVTIAYDEQQTDPTNETGVEGNRRWSEEPRIDASESDPTDPGLTLVLARVSRSGTTVTALDFSQRRSAGVVGGDLEVSSLALTDPNVVSTQWPRLRLGAANRADVQSSLRVEGNIDVTGTVDGRDVSTDGSRLDTHMAQRTNPHRVTAAQAGALISVEGVSNPGGNIDLAPTNAITVSGNNAQNRITIGENHSALRTNPHGVTAAQAGALISVEGVSNPGGNIDLAPTNAITVSGNNAQNRITIGENHSALRTNPHGVTAAQVGALRTTGGTVTGSVTFQRRVNLRVTTTDNPVLFLHNAHAASRIGLWASVTRPGGAGPSSNNAAVMGDSKVAGVFGVAAQAPTGTHALFVQGTARFTGAKTGYVVDSFVNASGKRLQTGDIVKLKGTPITRFLGDNNKIPVAEISLSDTENDNMVIGIVDGEAIPEPDAPDTRVGPDDPTFIEDGGEVYVVTLGAYAHCKVDATEAPIEVGDLLTSSANPGHARKATEAKIGCIIGKALEPLEEGTGYIAVFVNIQ